MKRLMLVCLLFASDAQAIEPRQQGQAAWALAHAKYKLSTMPATWKCPCSSQCACGCNTGDTCRCQNAPPTPSQAQQPACQIINDRVRCPQ